MILRVDEEGFFYFCAGLAEEIDDLDADEPIEPDAVEVEELPPLALSDAAE